MFYVNFETLFEKLNGSKNNPERSFTTGLNKKTISFCIDTIDENVYYRDEDSMWKFSSILKENDKYKKIINIKEKMRPLTLEKL